MRVERVEKREFLALVRWKIYLNSLALECLGGFVCLQTETLSFDWNIPYVKHPQLSLVNFPQNEKISQKFTVCRVVFLSKFTMLKNNIRLPRWVIYICLISARLMTFPWSILSLDNHRDELWIFLLVFFLYDFTNRCSPSTH